MEPSFEFAPSTSPPPRRQNLGLNQSSGTMTSELTVGSLFSGIGGLDLGLERAGMRVKWQCEIEPFCQAVLRKHWPEVHLHGDIRDIDETAERVDVICGGFPCQPVSNAGLGRAQDDPRWLWPEFARVVGLLRPRYVIVENVPGLRSKGLGLVLEDLSALGYDAEWDGIPASFVGAGHQRDRLWIVAYPARRRWSGSRTEVEDAKVFCGQLAREDAASWRAHWDVEPSVGRVANGVPGRVAQLKALGNSVVPQVAELVGQLLMEANV